MKRLSTLLIIAMALVLGLTQCKKKVETIATPNDLGKTVHITVNVGGDKHDVFTNTGAVVYRDGDEIYVGNNGKYIGTLTYSSGAFSGDVYDPSTEDYLHFYFVGGLTPSVTPEAGTTTSFTVSITDQSSKLPVLSYGRSTVKYTDASTTYGCTLLNKCGLVKFVTSVATGSDITVGGMKTEATVDFATPGITPTGTTGAVKLYSNPESETEKWAILLPQDEVSNPTVTIDGCTSTIESVPAVTNNMYYTTGVDITMTAEFINGKFTIGDGKQVYFSKGNLQAKIASYSSNKATASAWKFAENQWDYIGSAAGNTSFAVNSWVDLFSWVGASADNDTYGLITFTSNSQANHGNVLTESLKTDWGTAAASDIGAGWRTLTKDEWVCVFNTRTSGATVNGTSNARYTEATINTDGTSRNGIILFPDGVTIEASEATTWGTINGTSSWATKCTAAQWTALEDKGCVFLPAAGRRNGTTVNDAGSYGLYWSSTAYSETYAYYLFFYSSRVDPSSFTNRYYGGSVRLVVEL